MDELKQYLDEAFELFREDPPDSRFQKGYLAGLIAVAREVAHVTVPLYIEDLVNFDEETIN